MKINFLTPALAVFSLLVSCKQKENNTAAEAPPLRQEMRSFSKKTCVQAERCAEMKFQFPEFSGGKNGLASAINDTVRHYVMSVAGSNFRLPFAASLDSAAADFEKSYLEYAKNEGGEMGWSIESEAKVLLQNAKVLSLEFSDYSFTGGAHPNSSVVLYTFDLSTGKTLGIAELIKDTTLLLPLLENGFRKAKELDPKEPLSSVLYPDLPSLPLPAMVAVTPEGVRFFYNSYEVAPYAVGPTDILLTWAELGPLAEKGKFF